MSSSKYPRYESYKDSGVEWLGEMPASWDVKRLKTIAALVTSKAVSADYPVALENIEGWTGRFLPTDTEFQAEGTAFRKGDVLFGKLRPYLAKVWLADRSGEAVGDIFTLRPKKETYGQYLRSVLVTPEIIKMLDGSTFGSKMPRVSWDFMSTLRLPVPPVGEQESIAAFLDRETAKIDNLIAKQERLIELLTEKKQAVITQAVTKGLNPNVPMKNSGVEWLGKVPKHWVVGRTSRYFKIAMGQTILKEDLIEDGEWPIFSATEGDQYFGRIDDPAVRLKGGDLVIPARGNSIGFVKLAKENCSATQTTIYCKNLVHEKLLSSYCYYFMRGLKPYLFSFTQTAIPQITVAEVGANPVLVPHIEEQKSIAAFLDRATAKIDNLIEKSKRAIELQKEHRASLISAAVTGKIDVRGLA